MDKVKKSRKDGRYEKRNQGKMEAILSCYDQSTI